MQIMDDFNPRSLLVVFSSFLFLFPWPALAQSGPLDEQAVIRGIDAAVKARVDAILTYTDTEHYAVFRGGDEAHPVAEMTVRTTYQRDTGKSYQILSESGSGTLQRLVLHPILDREREINRTGNREGSWITSANYEIKLKPGGLQSVEGRPCYVLLITPRQKAPNLIQGTLWVDAKDESIVKLEGVASKSVSVFTGPTQVMRQYIPMNGFAEATHARAVSGSYLFGQTVVTIDYQNYEIKIRATR
jgi:hypothetical protein